MTSPNTEKGTAGRTEFYPCNISGQQLFRVNPGISIEDALDAASHLQSCANQFALEAAMSDSGEQFSWAAHHLGQMAKALIDDVTNGMFLARSDE